MLDGRYPSEKFAELRPRLVWDRTAGTVRGRKGARQLAVTNAGTIPDRGLYGVHLPDGRRVGELDEEMVYEARPGQTFLLGATTWRIEDITRDRVIVTPRPACRGRCRSGAATGSGARRSSVARSAPSPARRSAPTPRPWPPRTTSTRARPRTWSPTCASSRPRPGSCPPTRRSSSSASGTRSATGGSACSPRSAAASTPPGGLRSRPGSATSSSSRRTRSGPTTGSSSTSPTPTSPPTPTSSCSSPTRSRTWSCASSAARRCSAPAFARTPPAAC